METTDEIRARRDALLGEQVEHFEDLYAAEQDAEALERTSFRWLFAAVRGRTEQEKAEAAQEIAAARQALDEATAAIEVADRALAAALGRDLAGADADDERTLYAGMIGEMTIIEDAAERADRILEMMGEDLEWAHTQAQLSEDAAAGLSSIHKAMELAPHVEHALHRLTVAAGPLLARAGEDLKAEFAKFTDADPTRTNYQIEKLNPFHVDLTPGNATAQRRITRLRSQVLGVRTAITRTRTEAREQIEACRAAMGA